MLCAQEPEIEFSVSGLGINIRIRMGKMRERARKL